MKNSTKFSLAALAAVLVVALAVFLGVAQRHLSESEPADNLEMVELSTNTITSNPSDVRVPQQNNLGSQYSEPRIRTLHDIEKLATGFSRRAALYRLLEHADETTVLRLIDESKAMESESRRRSVQHVIFSRYATIDPKKALRSTRNLSLTHQRQLELTVTILFVWAEEDLDGALTHASSMSAQHKQLVHHALSQRLDDFSPEERRKISEQLNLQSQNLFPFLADGPNLEFIDDPKTEWYKLLENEARGDFPSDEVLLQVAQLWIQRDGSHVIHELNESLPNSNRGQTIMSRLLALMTVEQPQQAMALAIELAEDSTKGMGNPSALLSVALTWSQTDPLNALQEISSMESTPGRQFVQSAILTDWARRDPQTVLSHLNELPSEMRGQVLTHVVAPIAQASPEQALEVFAQIEDPTAKHNAAMSIANSWSLSDPRAALDWVIGEFESEHRRELATSLVLQYASIDPVRAITLALDYEDNESEIGELVPKVMSHIAHLNEGAYDDIHPSAGGQVFGNIQLFSFPSEKVDPDKIFSLAQTLDEKQEQRLFSSSILRSWAKSDPRRLFERLSEFRSQYISYRAANVLLRSQDGNPSAELSASEIESLRSISAQLTRDLQFTTSDGTIRTVHGGNK